MLASRRTTAIVIVGRPCRRHWCDRNSVYTRGCEQHGLIFQIIIIKDELSRHCTKAGRLFYAPEIARAARAVSFYRHCIPSTSRCLHNIVIGGMGIDSGGSVSGDVGADHDELELRAQVRPGPFTGIPT